MKTKLFTLLLAVAASVGIMFAESGTCGDNLTWYLTNNVLTISGTGTMYDYDYFYNLSPWKYYKDQIKQVVIKNGVTSIGNCAFKDCDYLASVTIPNSVTSIGDDTFYGCYDLTSVTIPNSITSIGNYAFGSCWYLTSITIPNSVISIGEGAFSSCAYLTSVEIPNSVTSIGNSTFRGCSRLAFVTIPNSVISIGDYAFYECYNLTSVTIPNSVTEIGDYAFYGGSLIGEESALKTLVIGSGVEYIGSSAFAAHKKLRSLTCKATNPPLASANCFKDINVSIPLYVPVISIEQYKQAPEWKEFYNVQAINTEAIESVHSNESYDLKTIRGGHIFVRCGDKIYTIQGQEVE